MLERRYAGLTTLLCAGIAAALAYAAEPPAWLEGLMFDAAVAVSAPARDDAPAAVAVVAIDARSLDASELAEFPRAMFGPIWARTIAALQKAEVKAIAFDMVLPYSANRFQAGFDTGFLRALAGARDLVVLGRSSRTLPACNYQAALRFDPAGLGLTEVLPARDGVFRRIESWFPTSNGDPVASLVGAALARAGVRDPPRSIVLAPSRHPESLPTYSLIDVLRCADSEPRAVAAAFSGKIVFIGTTLPEEDRKVSSARFFSLAARPSGGEAECGLRRLAASVPDTREVPGVHLHAAATQSVLSGRIVVPAAAYIEASMAGVAALAGAAAGFLLTPVLAVLAVIVGGGVLWGAEVLALLADIWLDMASAVLSLIAAAVIAYLVRFLVVERSRRRIHNAFGHYLAPALVERLAAGAGTLKLGGEARDVTIMFADLSGFTALSGKLGPEALVETTNAYLKRIAEAVDDSGGYVDKFIGDAVMAIWNAPADAPDHPAQGVAAALDIVERIAAARREARARGEFAFDIKIGVNTGPAVVGNVGSDKRYNYTAVGEAVNIAARLEGLPGVYGCRVIIGPETAARVAARYRLREIDAVAVKGKIEPLRVYEPAVDAPPHFAPYAQALEHYRNREFGAAAALWEALADRDGPSATMAARARNYAQNPPSEDWDGVFVMTGK